MKSLISNLLEKHTEELNKVAKEFRPISEKCSAENIRVGTKNDGSTSFSDCRFLQLLCIEKQPKKILEIGTWVGSTAYAMAFATNDSNASIHTCDNQNAFCKTECPEAKRINLNPNTYSSDLLTDKKALSGIDYIFNDANVSYEDCKKIYDLAVDNFYFVTHDYYDSIGKHEKGYEAIQNLIKVLDENNAKYNLYTPEKEWYFEGYKDSVNGCCAFLECTK